MRIETGTGDNQKGKTTGKNAAKLTAEARKCREKFLHFFPKGFLDEKYFNWERGYKIKANEEWKEALSRREFSALLEKGEFSEIANRAIRIESRTNLLFSFEKMALRDGVKTEPGAKDFAKGLFDFLYGSGKPEKKFERWCETLASLPRRQTRVLTWTTATVFGFIAQPEKHIFLKPNVTRAAAGEYGFDFQYRSRPSWEIYQNLFDYAETIRRDQTDLEPQDYIDLQSFIWVMGSSEYD